MPSPPYPEPTARRSSVVAWCALAAMALGVAVMAGWLLGIEPLKRVLPGLATMKFNTALGFLLAGCALLFRARPALRTGLAAAVALLGAITLGEYLAGRDFGIDQLFVRVSPVTPGQPPGRMSPATAVCFLLSGVGLALIERRRTERWAEGLALAVGTTGFVALLGYVFDARTLYRLPGFVSVALHTAFGFTLLAMGMLAAVRDGIVALLVERRGSARLMWLGFGMSAALLVTLGVVSAIGLRSISERVAAQAELARPRAAVARELGVSVIDYALGVRAFLSGHAASREEAAKDARDVAAHLEEYGRLSETPRHRELAERCGALWRELHTLGDSLMTTGAATVSELARLEALRGELKAFLDEVMQPEAVSAFDSARDSTLDTLWQTESLTLLLLIVAIVLALITSGAAVRAVLGRDAALRASQERLSLARSAARIGIHDYDVPTGVIHWDERERELWGASAEEVITIETFWAGVHPEDRAATEAAVRRALDPQGDGYYQAEYRVIHRTAGTIRWIAANGQTFFEAGKPVRLIGTVQDVTDRKRAEEKLIARAGQLDLLARTAQRLIGSGEPSRELLAEVFADIGRLIDVGSFFFYHPVLAERRLQLEICEGASAEERRLFATMNYGELLCGRVAETGERIIIEDLQHSTEPGSEVLRDGGAQSYAGFPLLDTGGALLGTLAFISKKRARFRDGDVQTIETVCAQVAATLERARLLAKLRDGQERLRLATDAAGLGVWEWSPAADVARWENAWAHEILGLAPTDPPVSAAQFVEKFLLPEEREKFETALTAAVHEKAPFRFQGKIRRADGEVRWVEFTGKAMLGASPKDLRLLGTVRDITVKHQATETVQRNASLFADLIEQAPMGVYVVDADFGLQQVNTQARPVFRTVDPLLGRDFDEVLHILWGPEVGERIAAIFRHTLATGERYVSPPFTEKRDDLGVEQTYEWETQRLTLPDGRPGVVCYFHEVTERARALRELSASEQRMRLATEATGVGIWEWHVRAGLVRWDAEMFRIYGIAPTQGGLVEYETWRGAVLPEDIARQEEVLQDTLRRCGKSQREFRIRRASDGECRWVQAVETVRLDAQGAAEWVVGTNLDVTERRRATEALRASEARLALGVHVAELKLAEVDYTNGFIHLTAEAARLFGLGEAAMLVPRDTMHATFHPDDRAELERRIASSLAPGGNGGFEMDHRVVLPDGEVRWLRVRKQVAFVGEGAACRPVRATLAMLDISSEKAAAEAVRASEEFVRGVLDSLPEQVVVLDDHGVVRSVNEPWRRFAQENGAAAPGVSIGVNYLEVCRQAAAEGDVHARGALEGLQAVLSGRQNFCSLEYPCHAPGREQWFLMQAQRASHGPSGVILSHVDITERKAAEERLRESEARVRGILRQSPAGIVQTDTEGCMTLVNARWCEMLGYTEAELLGRSVLEVTHPASRELTLEKVRQIREGGPDFQIEKIYCRKDGSPLRAQSNVTAVRSPDGQFLGLIAVVLDMTERLSAEEAIREEAKRKDEFLAMLGHELRNPLNAIRHAVQLSRESPDDREARQWAEGVIDRQSQQLSRMVEDLLDVARINRGRIELRPERIDVATVIDRALAVVRPLVEQRRHTVTTEMAGPLPVTGDAARLEQVFVNLLNNAAKYTAEGGSISVRAQREDGEVVVKITDTGVGISSDLLPHVFDLFRQADSSLDRSIGGLGIGLSVVKSLVDMHLGHVGMESAGTGRGTTVTVRLPLLIELETRPAFTLQPSTAPALPRSTRVIIVDDHQDAAHALARLLTRRGCEVRCAHSGPEGITQAREFRPEVLLLDLGLPGIDGYEVTRQLRAEAPFAEALFIAISGYAQDRDRQRSLAAGFDDHLSKPIDLPKLLEAIRARCTV